MGEIVIDPMLENLALLGFHLPTAVPTDATVAGEA
jgi:hypothetical protein